MRSLRREDFFHRAQAYQTSWQFPQNLCSFTSTAFARSSACGLGRDGRRWMFDQIESLRSQRIIAFDLQGVPECGCCLNTAAESQERDTQVIVSLGAAFLHQFLVI